ncbi:MAG TPA: hypothetical protein VL172_18185, partial [Kofleriaceae bacterium]|nr:hypothetical protein [Kofleriaceae bacterium]
MRALCLVLVAAAGCGAGSVNGADAAPDADDGPFSFFVTSLATMRAQSGSQDGFGGDLGGLAGADEICRQAAAAVGFGDKTWRAFLSVTDGGDGQPVNAIDRVGTGPWYDRAHRLVAADAAGLVQNRPDGDPAIMNDLPDETGAPLSLLGDAHDVMTGSDTEGHLLFDDPVTTCQDWTSAVGPGSEGQVAAGHSWPADSGSNWIAAHALRGCAAGVNLIQDGPGTGDCVGCSGGYGAIYCL